MVLLLIKVVAHLPPTIPICTPNLVMIRLVVEEEIGSVENGRIITRGLQSGDREQVNLCVCVC